MDEEMIVTEVVENNSQVDTEIIEQEIEQDETVEYIEVGETEEIEITIDETMGYAGAGNGNYAPLDHTHPINQIEKLNDTLHNLASSKEYHSTNSGFAEFRQWNPNGYYKKEIYEKNIDTSGLGYFVSLVRGTGNINGGNTYIDICQSKNDDGTIITTDIYGVTVDTSGFYGYQSPDYNPLNSQSINKAKDFNYAVVCLLGDVKVRVTDETLDDIKIGDYALPNEDGYAVKSKNNIGYKVISKGTIEKGWNYVEIALVPQSDNISRVMKELEDAKVTIGNVSLELGNVGNKVDGIFNSSINVSNKVDNFQGILDETTQKVDEQIKISQDVSEKAQEVVKETKETINTIASQYSEAVNKADDAHKVLHGDDGNGGVLKDLKNLQEDMQPLAEWKGQDGSTGVAAFVAQANEDRTQLASLTTAFGPNGSDITAIIQKIDENGAAIQHLVSHVDQYVLGSYSPAYGLKYDETIIIKPGTIYVPTNEHEETYSDTVIAFEENMSYMWQIDNTGKYIWTEYKPVSTETDYFKGTNEGDLWYCWKGVLKDDKILYDAGTLYCWDNTKELWIAVASVNDNPTSRVVGLVNQAADKMTSVYENLQGDMSAIIQSVKEIRTIVESTETGAMSTLQQTAEEILMGVYNPLGAGTLGLLMDGLTSNTTKASVVKIKSVNEAPPEGNKYEEEPIWTGEKFEPVGKLSATGRYYFENDCFTYFCYVVDDENYEVYGVSNVTLASLHTRVSDTETEVASWASFIEENTKNIATINQTVTDNASKISLIASGEYVVCTEVCLEPTVENIAKFSSKRYSVAPAWKDNGFVFDEDNEEENGVYCMIDGENDHYYKLFYNDDKVIATYYKYELASSGSATIAQKVEENSSSIGMVVENIGKDGKVDAASIVTAINNGSSLIDMKAVDIDMTGYVTFNALEEPGRTTINGDNIKTGAIKSNNYSGPVTYYQYGIKLGETLMDFVSSFTAGKVGYDEDGLKYNCVENVLELFPNELPDELASGGSVRYYCKYNKKIIPIIFESKILNNKTELVYYLDDIIIQDTIKIDIYNGKRLSIIEGKSSDCIWFQEIEIGKNYQISPNARNYYSTEEIKVDTELLNLGEVGSSDRNGNFTSIVNGYIVSDENFDLIPEGILIDGTKFDLDVGSIYSKNFVLDRFGHVTITGQITATSGYIGDEERGFIIDESSLYNGQTKLKGATNKDEKGNSGVYLGVDGIGLGNGNFYVNSVGDLVTYGSVVMHGSDGKPAVEIDDGNLILYGNITLGGKIGWDATNSPVMAAYSSTGTGDPNLEPGYWTSTFDPDIHIYMTMSFDGGDTWNAPTKIVAKDGKDGSNGLDGINGSDASVTPETVFNALTENGKIQGLFGSNDGAGNLALYINAEYIRAGTLSGMNFTDETGTSLLKLSSTIEQDDSIGGDVSFADLTYWKKKNGEYQEVFQINDFGGGTFSMRLGGETLITTGLDKNLRPTNIFRPRNVWDFSQCEITDMIFQKDTTLTFDNTTVSGDVIFDTNCVALFDGFVDFRGVTEFTYEVNFTGNVDFSHATVTGITVVPVFA